MPAGHSAISRTPWGTPTRAPPDGTTRPGTSRSSTWHGLTNGTGLRPSRRSRLSLQPVPGSQVQDRGLEAGLIAAPGSLSLPPAIPCRTYTGATGNGTESLTPRHPYALSRASAGGGPRTKSSESTGHRHISSYSSWSSSGHQPSRDVTGGRPLVLPEPARQLSRSCRYRSFRSRCRSAGPVDSAASARSTAPRCHPSRPRSASPCSASTCFLGDR